jgi:hypothetical protein
MGVMLLATDSSGMPPASRTARQHWVDLVPDVAWHGEVDEFVRLISSIGMHCTCRSAALRHCGAHELLADQHTLDHLAFARGMRQQFVEAEWDLVPSSPGQPRAPSVIGPARSRERAQEGGGRSRLMMALATAFVFLGLVGAWAQPVSPVSGTLASAQGASIGSPPLADWRTR